MYQKKEGCSEQLPGYETGCCGAGEKEEMKKMRDNGCSGCKYEHLKGSEKPCCDCANMHMDKYEPITNADRIRNMSDEELAEFMSENTSCYYCKVQCEDRPNSPTESSCNFRWLDWLQSEAE